MKNIVEFILEAGVLKRTPRSGWSLLGVDNAESVADHSFRTAVIGYVLARLEGADTGRVLLMTLFNDTHEARITDLHKMAQHYVDADGAESRAFADQTQALPDDIRAELNDVRRDYESQTSKESIIARDADILECLIQAREYEQHGHGSAVLFTKNAGHLQSDSAKKLWAEAEHTDINEWWSRIGKFER